MPGWLQGRLFEIVADHRMFCFFWNLFQSLLGYLAAFFGICFAGICFLSLQYMFLVPAGSNNDDFLELNKAEVLQIPSKMISNVRVCIRISHCFLGALGVFGTPCLDFLLMQSWSWGVFQNYVC